MFYLKKLMFTLREENIAWRHVDSVIFLHPCVGFLGSEALVSTLMHAFYGFHWSLKQSMCLYKFVQRGRKRYQFNQVIKYLIVTDKKHLKWLKLCFNNACSYCLFKIDLLQTLQLTEGNPRKFSLKKFLETPCWDLQEPV